MTRIDSCAFYNTAYFNNNDNSTTGDFYMTSKDGSVKYLIKAYKSVTGTFTFDSKTKVIAGDAFQDCIGLTTVVIPTGIPYIESNTFFGCTNLTSVTIPNTVEGIGYGAFSECCSLTTISIPNTVKEIGGSAFRKCTKLTSITIPEGVTCIEKNTFQGCVNLKTVNIPVSLIRFETDAFYTDGVNTINYAGTKAQWESISFAIGWYSHPRCTLIIYCSDGAIVKEK